jgi:hypothetical protein
MVASRQGDELQRDMSRTYYGLRWGMFGVALLLPWALLVGELLAHKGPQPLSMSAYYHTELRNVLVGSLIAVGCGLYLYKGFSRPENILLNIAGVAAICVAFLPCAPDRGATDGRTTFTFPVGHGIAALVLFACIGITSVVFGPLTLPLVTDAQLRTRLRRAYRVVGVLMIVLPGLAAILSVAGIASLFWIEAAAVIAFCLYWALKTYEFRRTAAETKAIRGVLPELTT